LKKIKDAAGEESATSAATYRKIAVLRSRKKETGHVVREPLKTNCVIFKKKSDRAPEGGGRDG